MARRSFSLAVRIFVVYASFVALGGWFVTRQVLDEVKPAVRQSTEETLVDTANLLAEVLREDVARRTLTESRWPELLREYGTRRPNAEIWGIAKARVSHRVYVVDDRGIVLVDSAGNDVGADYSRWRDVYLTLRGQYGARSTQAIPGDESSTVMYVAAPIVDAGRIVGAVTVAKPNHTVQPFIERSKARLLWLGAGLVGVGLALGALLSYWLAHAVRRLTDYARLVSAGERVAVPTLPGGELTDLVEALERMRSELDGQAYVERYVQTLTHELKSPLSAIRGAAELLHDEMPPDRRARFLSNIETESARLEALAERLLLLAQVEKRRGLEERIAVDVGLLLDELKARFSAPLERRRGRFDIVVEAETSLVCERFLLVQALENLVDNALDFTPSDRAIRLEARPSGSDVLFVVENEGPPIPDYARERVTERFYSLPRPSTGRKSTGLGLAFVKEVAELHGGTFRLDNVEGGVRASLRLPRIPSSVRS